VYRIEMPHIKRKWQGKHLYIEGGWPMLVPRVTLESCVPDAWALYLRQSGSGTIESVTEAIALGQSVYEAGYQPKLMSHTMYWAKQYAERYPDMLKPLNDYHPIYVVEGFDPEIVQSSFVPLARHGRRGQPFMDNMLREMRDEY